jgi:hypothetical protein
MALQIQLRRDTSTNWTSTNPTLAQGEIGIETDTGKFKIGTGSTAWNSLGYAAPEVSGAASTIISSNLTASRALASDSSGKVAVSTVTSTELGHLSGVTSAVQTQLNARATLTGTETLTNKTLTAPRFETAGEIDDSNGNELIKFPATVASAVNEVTIANAIATAAPTISATGNDTNISLNLVSKGTGVVQANGVTILTTAGTATTATNLAGGTAGRIPYQTGSNTTAFVAVGTSGQVLISNGTSAPTWSAPPTSGFNAFLLSGM